MNYDITFCDNPNCKNKKCTLNINNIPDQELLIRQGVWARPILDCPYYKGGNNEN